MRFSCFFAALAVVLAAFACLASPAGAEVLQAPIGGKPIPLGDSLIACATTAGVWKVEPGGRAVRPPVADSAVGVAVELPVALSQAECAHTALSIRLVATGPWPALDASSFVLSLDEGRLEGHGRGLHGVLVTWPTDDGRASDNCRNVDVSNGVETCRWGVPKTLSADPTSSALRWLPAGAQVGPNTQVFDAEGRLAAPESFAIAPSRIELTELVPADAAIDVSSGTGRMAITHPEAVTGVDCAPATCHIDSGTLLLQSPPASVGSVDVKFRLLQHVLYTRKKPPDPQPTVRLSVLRCPMSVVSGPPLRGLDSARTVVRVEGACMQDLAALHFLAGGRPADVTQVETSKDAAYAVLDLGSTDAPNVTITALREGDTVVAVARTDTRAAPPVRTVLEIPGYPPIDFIPNNRFAVVHYPRVAGAELVVLPLDDVYEAKSEPGGLATVRGDVNAVGSVALQFGFRMPSLPAPLDKVNLAVLSDALHRSVKPANVPAPFGMSALTQDPLVELLCFDEKKKEHRIMPGVPIHLPFGIRDDCRLVIHRERMSEEYGTQKLNLEIEVDKLDGTPRPESHLNQTLIVRAGPEPRIAWIKGVMQPYDRVLVRLSHVADEAHYIDALDIPTGAPMVQWNMGFGTGRVRLYGTTAIPTGLYRFGTAATSGVLSLSLGIITRLTWLDTDGHEGLLGLEAGMMAFGLTGDTSSSGTALTQVGAVLGVGVTIPIAGAGSPTQASINLHAWAEQRITGSGEEAASSRALIFGPSISLGNVGTTF